MRPTGAQVRELTEQGMSDRLIGKKLHCAMSTIQQIRKENGISPGVWGRAKEGSRRYQERYGSTYNPEPAVKVADEKAWAKALAGGRYEDAIVYSEGRLRVTVPALWSTGESSMSWAG